MPPRKLYQKILLTIAFISYALGAACGAGAAYLAKGDGDPVVASLMASVVFFVGVGVVVHVMASGNLPNLKVE